MSQYDNLMQLLGNMAARQISDGRDDLKNLSDAEFRVFSQFGDDGIIQYLIRKCRIQSNERRFVEFGTENYSEANTRFLLTNNNWSGFIMDPSPQNIAQIQSDDISWRHDLQSRCCCVTPGNINDLLRAADFSENLGLFSIDIDGMDYWVWKALECADPVIVICEYNSVFGSTLKVTVPYDENFNRTLAHHSNLYFGASLAALVALGESKNYAFVGSNSSGNNAYFVRNDRVGDLPTFTSEQGYVESRFRESRDAQGRLTYLRGQSRLALIEHLPIYDLATGSVRPLRDAEVERTGLA